jgi:uncharacterized GH25 family protein
MKAQSGYAFHFAAVLIVLSLGIAANRQVPALQASTQSGTQAGGAIKGKVKEQGGKALEGVTVRIASAKKKDTRQGARETKTDAKGDYDFAGLEADDYALEFEKTGYKTFISRRLTVPPGETVRLNPVELRREGDPYSVIRGAVFYGVGYTLPNATVILERIDGGKKFRQETISREGGEFAFRLKAEKAQYRITASARGFQPASTEIEIESEEVRNIALTLQPVK